MSRDVEMKNQSRGPERRTNTSFVEPRWLESETSWKGRGMSCWTCREKPAHLESNLTCST